MGWRLLDDGWVERELMVRLNAADGPVRFMDLVRDFPGEPHSHTVQERALSELNRLIKEGAVERTAAVLKGPTGREWQQVYYQITPLFRLAAIENERGTRQEDA